MANNPVRNYAIPGLTSWLVGDGGRSGCVRLFHCERNHQEAITPHSHRFDFTAMVLQGQVINRVWTENSKGDLFHESDEEYLGEFGKFKTTTLGQSYYSFEDTKFFEGDQYFMASHEIHSIFFAKDTYVLMFEGPAVTTSSIVLEPVVDGKRIPTFKTEEWMFQRGVPFKG